MSILNRICKGCGSSLQCKNIYKEGYIKATKIDTAEYCERCFKILHYGEFSVLKEDIDYKYIFQNIRVVYHNFWNKTRFFGKKSMIWRKIVKFTKTQISLLKL